MRGFAVIALNNPKSGENVGGVMRAAGVYGAALVVIGGPRYKKFKKFPTDTMKAWKHIPTLEVDDVFSALPHDCVPVAVELLEGATLLPEFRHPERAFYIFGAEDQTLGRAVTDRCPHKVIIPTAHCMNLAAIANVVLYDRLAKQTRPDPWAELSALRYRNRQAEQSIERLRDDNASLRRKGRAA